MSTQEADYRRYLSAFNAQDYDEICRFFTPDVSLSTMGYVIKGHAGIRAFYNFFHQYLKEQISLREAWSRTNSLYAETLSRFTVVPAGLVVNVELPAAGTPVHLGTAQVRGPFKAPQQRARNVAANSEVTGRSTNPVLAGQVRIEHGSKARQMNVSRHLGEYGSGGPLGLQNR